MLKLLQIMTDKGVVGRDESERANVFAATVSERPFRSGLGELTS